MQKDIHPKYIKDTQINCICGHSFNVSSTMNWPVKVDICPNCHSTYNKWIKVEKESIGRLQKFEQKMAKIGSIKK